VTATDRGLPHTLGELGIRHEDAVVVTEKGCESLAPKVIGDARGAGGGVRAGLRSGTLTSC
jgi:hypothetical protein